MQGMVTYIFIFAQMKWIIEVSEEITYRSSELYDSRDNDAKCVGEHGVGYAEKRLL